MFQVKLVSWPRGINDLTFRALPLSLSGGIIQTSAVLSLTKPEKCPFKRCNWQPTSKSASQASNDLYAHIMLENEDKHPVLSEDKRKNVANLLIPPSPSS
jgi:hypothetical protein